MDVGPLLVEHFDFHGVRILTAADRVPLGVEQGRGHRQHDFMDAGCAEGVGRVDLVGGRAVAEIPEMVRTRCGGAGELDRRLQADRSGRREGRYGCGADVHALLDHLDAAGPSDGHADGSLSGASPFDFGRRLALRIADEGASGDGPVIAILIGVGREDGGDGAFADRDAIGIGIVDGSGLIQHPIGGRGTGIEHDGRAVAFGLFAFHDDGDTGRAAAVGGLQRIGKREGPAATAAIWTASGVEDGVRVLFMGEARGQTLNRNAEEVHVDDVVV